MDDSLTLLHTLTWRSRLHGLWLRFTLYLSGARYTAKLMRLAHKNILVLQHFCRCREVEQLQYDGSSRFRHLSFYRETFRQCLRLFSPLRAELSTPTHEHVTSPRSAKKKARAKKTSAAKVVPTCQHPPRRRTAQSLDTGALSQVARVPQLPATAALATSAQEKPLPQHGKLRFKLHTWVLWLRCLPYDCLAKCKSLLRIKSHKAQQRQFYQQAQLTLLQEQQRIATSTQAALFLSLATAIDLKAARELTAAGQLVGKQRQHRTMTAEDTACFYHSLNALDGNHETIRVAVQ